MGDLTRQSDRLIADARAVRDDNREGGRHRRASIGRGSAEMKREHLVKKLRNIAIAAAAIFAFAVAAGIIVDGIGFTGVVTVFFALLAAGFVLGRYPRMKVPRREDLTRTDDVRQLVGKTELWLEAQRPALPAPAVRLVDDLGVQLDALGLQLEQVPADHQVARDIRELVGETLPEMVDSYRKIPGTLRGEERAGSTPDRQLVDGLGRISREIDQVTRQLADGALDNLAVKSRYLEYRYGGDDQPQTENK